MRMTEDQLEDQLELLGWTDEQIIELFARNPDMLVSEIVKTTGLDINQLSTILLGESQ